jgi:hypothetical protein
MKLLFGNATSTVQPYYAEKLEELIRNEGARQDVLLLGDCCTTAPATTCPGCNDPKSDGHSERPENTGAGCARGNCDAEVDQMVLEFPSLRITWLCFWKDAWVRYSRAFVQAGGKLPISTRATVYSSTAIPTCVLRRGPGRLFLPEPRKHGASKRRRRSQYMVYEDGVFTTKDMTARCWKRWTSGADPWKDGRDRAQLSSKNTRNPFGRFIGGFNDYRLVNGGDRIAVCISAERTAFCLLKCMQQLQKHSVESDFEIGICVYGDPGTARKTAP